MLVINGKKIDTSRVKKKGIVTVADLLGAPAELTVMRVVDKEHPAYADALLGRVVPWGGPRALALQSVIAQTSGTRPDTGLTSWSTDRSYTWRLAQPGDAILLLRVPAGQAIVPPNAIGSESEVLLHGEIRNARVLRR